MCLDWSGRRPHLARRVGAAICRHGFDNGWLRCIDGTRAVTITRRGEVVFDKVFDVTWGTSTQHVANLAHFGGLLALHSMCMLRQRRVHVIPRLSTGYERV